MRENNEEYSALRQAAIERHKREIEAYEKITDEYELTKKEKLKLNRWWRERIGINIALHSEVDNAFERARSKIVRWWYEKNKQGFSD